MIIHSNARAAARSSCYSGRRCHFIQIKQISPTERPRRSWFISSQTTFDIVGWWTSTPGLYRSTLNRSRAPSILVSRSERHKPFSFCRLLIRSAYPPSNRDSLLHCEYSARRPFNAEQNGTSVNDFGTDVAIAGDGSIAICGRTYGNFSEPNAGEADMVVIKLSSDGKALWTWQVGLSS